MTRVLDTRGELITVRAELHEPALELCGELPCWEQPIAMQRVAQGWQAEMRVAPGVYPIKARRPGGPWVVDPAWRTLTCDGVENGALVVGGTSEPVMHAPVAPWLVAHDDGRVTVRAGLRRGTGERLAVQTDDGMRAMRLVRADATHLWFEVDLAGATKAIEYRFVLAGGRTLDALRAEPRAAEMPRWWRDAVVYTIFVDRFRGWRDGSAWQRDVRAGGTLDGVREAIPYLCDLGVSVLHLTPICESPSVHRYDATDPRAVDPALGGEEALAELLDAAHARGLRVVLDVATTHVHRNFAPFRDVALRGEASPYYRWFHVHRWPFIEGQDPGYRHYQKGQWEEPLLATDEPEVQDEIVDWACHWIRLGADGVRIDAAADLPVPLLARIRAAVRATNPRAIVFGEVVPSAIDRFAPGALDAATDFAHREALVRWLAGDVAASRVEDVASRQRARGAASIHALGFTGTHDQPRVATVTRCPALARVGLLATALGARVPLFYYGDELGLAASAACEFEDTWPDRQPMPWNSGDETTTELVRAALALRRAHPLFTSGDEDLVAHGDDVVHIRRRRLADAIDIVLYRGTTPTTFELPPGPARVLLAVDAALHGTTVTLGPRSAIVVDRRAPPEPELSIHNAAIAAQAAAGHLESPAYPVRLYVTVTERCNLTCAHCITSAPERTRSGRAREITPWLIDALMPAFAHADYVAFTHGGESLVSRRFNDVLRAIASARNRRPGRADVHLVSNGMLLDEERVSELADLGVTSLMVSLDGATAVTNDRIRILGKRDTVVANLRAAIKLRARRGVDLRIGISTVVGATNVTELPALGRLARELGVDWLKIEETYPATPFARRDLLASTAPALLDAMAALRDVLTGSSVVLVDHIAPPSGCVCSGAPDVLAFRAADDFANRATFRPCRAAWEQAAIDPDGTVHAIDYAGPALGNLLDAPMLALWNAPPIIALRESAMADRASRRSSCCADRPNR